MYQFALLVVLAFSIFTHAQDDYIREFMQEVARLTRGNLVFPDTCSTIPKLPEPISFSTHPACNDRFKFLTNSVHKIENQKAIKDLIDKKKPQLIVIGDLHGSPANLRFPEILNGIKSANPEIDCLFVEYPQTFFNKIQELQEKGSLPPTVQENIDIMVSQNQILTAKKIGLKVIPVDNHPDRHDPNLTNTPEGFRNRNKVMAEIINNKLKDGSCKAAVFIGGAFHWTKKDSMQDIPSLKDLIQAKTIAILPVNTGCYPTLSPYYKDPIWFLPACKSNPDRITYEAILETSVISDSVPLGVSGGKLNDFDLGIIPKPTYDENCKRIF